MIDQTCLQQRGAERIDASPNPVISHRKSIEYAGVFFAFLQEHIVGQRDEAVHKLPQLAYAVFGYSLTARTLKAERQCGKGENERIGLSRNFCHDGSRRAARAPTKADDEND